jgi:hypothetical protein
MAGDEGHLACIELEREIGERFLAGRIFFADLLEFDHESKTEKQFTTDYTDRTDKSKTSNVHGKPQSPRFLSVFIGGIRG